MHGTKLGRAFFERDPLVIARELIGMTLVRDTPGAHYVGVIAETGAYAGKPRQNWYGAGRIYLSTQGAHMMFCIGVEHNGAPALVAVQKVRSPEAPGQPVGFSDDVAEDFHMSRELEGAPINGDKLYITGESSPDAEFIGATASIPNSLGHYRMR